jgi:type IV fimbrial biogenesis protein FimT
MLGSHNAAHERGFSLIELVVTLAVLGLLMMAAMPSVGSWLRNTQVRNAAESIQNGLQRARSEAVRRNETVTFWLVSTSNGALAADCTLSFASASWVVSIGDPTNKCTDAPSQTVEPKIFEAHGQADGSASVVAAAKQADTTTNATRVTFNGFGRPTGATNAARIDLSLGDARSLRVEISTGGGVRLCDPNVSDDNDPRKCS